MPIPFWHKFLASLGINVTRLRWKYHAWRVRQQRGQRARENEQQALHYAHKLCPGCGLTVDRDERSCPRCKRALDGPALTRTKRYLRHLLPEGSYSYTTIFVAANVALYLAMSLQSGGGPSGLFSGPSGPVAVRFGAWWIPLIKAGQWWRLVTPIFLHFGLLHLLFNSLWLLQLGPVLERAFGRSRFLLLYLASGICGFVFSIGYRILSGARDSGIGGGASGVVFGLIAAALVLGYLRRAAGSAYFREGLFKWALFGLVMSLLPGIDLAAHLGGAVAGALCGALLATEGEVRRWRAPARLWLLIELACLGVLVAAFVLTIVRSPVLR